MAQTAALVPTAETTRPADSAASLLAAVAEAVERLAPDPYAVVLAGALRRAVKDGPGSWDTHATVLRNWVARLGDAA